MLSRNNRPHFIRSTTKEKLVKSPPKNRILLAVLAKTVKNKMKEYFSMIKSGSKNLQIACQLISKANNKNMNVCQLMAWQSMKFRIKCQAKNELILKKTFIMLEKQKTIIIMDTFFKIRRYGSQRENKIGSVLLSKRGVLLGYMLNGQIRKRLGLAFNRLCSKMKSMKNIRFKFESIDRMIKQIRKRQQLSVWLHLKTSKSGEEKDIQYELSNIVNDMNRLKRELAQKDEENRQLQKKLVSSQRNIKITTLTDIEREGARSVDLKRSVDLERKRSYSNEKQDNRSDANSQKGGSVLSWLNRSFFSFKSGKSSKASGGDCFCGYREKYNQYKYQSASLKNQLEIIKNELQITKDVNEHLQEEIGNLYKTTEHPNQFQIERLRKQCKQLRIEKEAMKQKMLKYQKYVANLKIEFKNKIESLYRNIKKNQ